MENENKLDLEYLGAQLQKERKAQGIRTAKEFAHVIGARTGYKISKGALERVEAGRQELPTSALCAVVLALFDGDWDKMLDFLESCYPKYWAHLKANPGEHRTISSILYDYRTGVPEPQE